MATLKEAVAAAVGFAREVLGEERTQDLRLEEVDVKPGSWDITLSMIDSGVVEDVRAFQAVLGGHQSREYKTFTVGTDGAVTAMKIRELEKS